MPSSSEPTSIRQRTATPTLQLHSWPLRDEPLRTLCIAAFEIAASGLAGSVAAHWSAGLLVGVLLGIASWQFWLPVEFELSSKGIVRTLLFQRRRILWSHFDQYESYPHGVFLSHRANREPFGVFRGLFLPSRTPHTELLAVLDAYFVAGQP